MNSFPQGGSTSPSTAMTSAGNNGPVRETEIRSLMGRLLESLEQQVSAVTILEKRLEIVLSPSTPTAAPTEKSPNSVRTPLGGGLDDITKRVRNNTDWINSLIQRIEV